MKAQSSSRRGTQLIHFTLSLLAFLAGSASILGQPSAIAPTSDAQSYLNDYEVPSGRIRAGFIPYKAKLVWGESLRATFTVENISSNEFNFTFGGDYRGTGRHDRFKIAVTNANGEALPDPTPRAFDFGGFLQPVNLKTGQSFSNEIDLLRFRTVDKPGVYTVDCNFAPNDGWNPKPGPTNLVIHSRFTLEILENTPGRIADVLDELVAKAKVSHGPALSETLTQLAQFGKDDAVPRLAQLTIDGPIDLRVSTLGVLPLIPTETSLEAVLTAFRDSDPTIRAAAASALGAMQKPRGVDALLAAFPMEKSPVAEAILLSLGASKSDRALPVITDTLDTGEIETKRAAINALVNFGGSNAVAALTQRINTNFLSVRYEIVLALVEKLRQPMQASWLSPVLVGREMNHEWLDSIRLLRMYAGDQAIPTLLSFLDYDVAWSGRNWWILETGVKPCKNAPACDYEHDLNSDGEPEQWQKNLQLLQTLKPLAGPVPKLPIQPVIPPPPILKTDPPIDFSPAFTQKVINDPDRDIEIKTGFLTVRLQRGTSKVSYETADSYRSLYHEAGCLRSLLSIDGKAKTSKISSVQSEKLNQLLHQLAQKLCNSRVINNKELNFYQGLIWEPKNCPFDDDWHFLHRNYFEAPTDLIRDQAKADLMNSVQTLSQNYHAGTVEFVESAKKIFSPAQLEEILK